MSATLPAVGIDVEVDLGILSTQPGGVWDGTETHFDYSTWQQTETELGDWLDVTCDTNLVVTLGAGSSADGVVTRWEAATASFDLYGELFDPRSGPYTGLLGPNTPVRVRWKPSTSQDWLTAFVGGVDDDGFTYDPKTKLAHVAATDATRIFAAYDGLEQSPQGSGESAAQRVERIADMVGWPSDRRDIEPGGVALQPTTLAEAAWTMLLAVADTDLALLWLTRAGQLAYRPQGKVVPQRSLSALISCTTQDVAESVLIVPVNIVGQQPTITRNVVSISRQSGEQEEAATVTVRDDTSVARFLTHTYQRTDLKHLDDAWSTLVGQAILLSSAWPSTAPEYVELSSRAAPAATALLLGLEPSLSVAVSDEVGVWLCEPAGWDVEIRRNEVSGRIDLLDVSIWWGDAWDNAGWDLARFGW